MLMPRPWAVTWPHPHENLCTHVRHRRMRSHALTIRCLVLLAAGLAVWAAVGTAGGVRRGHVGLARLPTSSWLLTYLLHRSARQDTPILAPCRDPFLGSHSGSQRAGSQIAAPQRNAQSWERDVRSQQGAPITNAVAAARAAAAVAQAAATASEADFAAAAEVRKREDTEVARLQVRSLTRLGGSAPGVACKGNVPFPQARPRAPLQAELEQLRSQSATPSRREDAAGVSPSAVDSARSALSEVRIEARRREARIAAATAGAEHAASATAARAEQLHAQRLQEARATAAPATRLVSNTLCGTAAVLRAASASLTAVFLDPWQEVRAAEAARTEAARAEANARAVQRAAADLGAAKMDAETTKRELRQLKAETEEMKRWRAESERSGQHGGSDEGWPSLLAAVAGIAGAAALALARMARATLAKEKAAALEAATAAAAKARAQAKAASTEARWVRVRRAGRLMPGGGGAVLLRGPLPFLAGRLWQPRQLQRRWLMRTLRSRRRCRWWQRLKPRLKRQRRQQRQRRRRPAQHRRRLRSQRRPSSGRMRLLRRSAAAQTRQWSARNWRRSAWQC